MIRIRQILQTSNSPKSSLIPQILLAQVPDSVIVSDLEIGGNSEITDSSLLLTTGLGRVSGVIANNALTTTYPEYNNGWHVTAEPNGDLTELSTNRKLYSLYWEGQQGQFETTDEGFIVKGSEVANFLEEKLPLLGLNAYETEEFIIYWLPIMQQNSYNYVRFATPTEIEEYMPLNITPKPDTTIRVLMVTKPLEHPITLHEQTLPDTPKRQGFTVVEWGGTK